MCYVLKWTSVPFTSQDKGEIVYDESYYIMAYKKIYVNDLYEIFYPQIVISFSHNNKNVRSA